MIITAAAFTDKGFGIIKKIEEAMPDMIVKIKDRDFSKDIWARDAFEKRLPIVFVGACGIAVRTIAPFVKDKLCDSPVIVIDEKGEYVIPILSGHMGAANEIAGKISKALGATVVITTATDVNDAFSVDVFARKNYMVIERREEIKSFSSKILKGEMANIYIDGEYEIVNNDMPEGVFLTKDKEKADIILKPKKYALGVGCKKGKSFEELRGFVAKALEANNIAIEDVAAINSIDIKKMEEGLNTLATYLRVPFITYSATELENVKGEFTESAFVKDVTGVSNVCERAAMSFRGAKCLYVKKLAQDGMTLAVAEVEGRIDEWIK